MVTRKSDPVGGEKHGTIEIAYVKLSGNDTTLQQAVQAFSSLINRAGDNGTALQSAKRVNALPATARSGAEPQNGTTINANEDIEVEHEAAEATETEMETETRAPKQPRKYTLPTAIAIETEAPIPLSDFMAQYKLESDQDRYVAMASWLWNHRDQTTLKAGLVLTLYARMDWKLLADVTMPMRRLVTKKFQWLEKAARGEYKIAQQGEIRLAKLKV